MFKIPDTIVQLTIGSELKNISLVQQFEFSGIIDIIMDKECHGQIQRMINGWTVNTIPESPITKEYYESLVNALNSQIPGSR